MKIILQSRETLRYFRDVEHWAADAKEAFAFKDVLEAVKVCRSLGLSNAQIVLQFDGSEDVTMPVPEMIDGS